ncbi:MAG: DUF6384 family protein [Sneathiellaceae bacterium]
MAGTGATAPDPAPDARGAPLDDLMLAMDVVDTLRHRESVALRELEQDGRDETLKDRLRRLYEGQGLAVSDRILEDGIRALKESRFTYRPTPPGLSRTLAGLWVRRAAIAWGLAVLALLVVAWAGWQHWQQASAAREAVAAQLELTETLPRRIAAAGEGAAAAAMAADARGRVAQLREDAAAALARGDAAAARVAASALERLREELTRVFELRIVSRPGEDSGVYRIPDVNTGARNYYLIVEAVTPDGRTLTLPVTSEEDGRTANVATWGVRVPRAVYEAVRRDKLDDGILQDNLVAEKPRGALDPVYRMAVSGGAITEW